VPIRIPKPPERPACPIDGAGYRQGHKWKIKHSRSKTPSGIGSINHGAETSMAACAFPLFRLLTRFSIFQTRKFVMSSAARRCGPAQAFHPARDRINMIDPADADFVRRQ
jgi:hypothetical protein